MASCPIPQVAQALEPYVKSRNEVLSIRNNLQTHLESHLRLDPNTRLSTANLASPPLIGDLGVCPESLTGVRKAYWRALHAHQKAQTRYETLKSELHTLATNNAPKLPDHEVANVLPLLREREKRRRVAVLERALAGVEAEGAELGSLAVNDLVRRRAGEITAPPSKAPHDRQVNGPDVRERIGELQRSVLAAKAVVEKSGSARATTGKGSELVALQQARNELIGWIERQLALIGEGQAEGDNVPATPENCEDDDVVISVEEIGELYDGYLDARRSLLSTLQAPERAFPAAEAAVVTESSQLSGSEASTAVTLLPYMNSLLDLKSSEQVILKQQTFLRKQLTDAEDITQRLLRRFADESHLVHPGASRGKDWSAAATETGAETKRFVAGKVNVGLMAAEAAESKLAAIDGVIDNLDRLGKIRPQV